jgi:hypothetical protein
MSVYQNTSGPSHLHRLEEGALVEVKFLALGGNKKSKKPKSPKGPKVTKRAESSTKLQRGASGGNNRQVPPDAPGGEKRKHSDESKMDSSKEARKEINPEDNLKWNTAADEIIFSSVKSIRKKFGLKGPDWKAIAEKCGRTVKECQAR